MGATGAGRGSMNKTTSIALRAIGTVVAGLLAIGVTAGAADAATTTASSAGVVRVSDTGWPQPK